MDSVSGCFSGSFRCLAVFLVGMLDPLSFRRCVWWVILVKGGLGAEPAYLFFSPVLFSSLRFDISRA